MEPSRFGNLIRIGKSEILSCTLKGIDEEKNLDFLDINFRKAVEKECGILFYEHEGTIYYPYAMEFRLIDNNILFLLDELKLKSFSELTSLLESSFKREEGRSVTFFAIVVKCLKKPRFSQALNDFVFDNEDVVKWVNCE